MEEGTPMLRLTLPGSSAPLISYADVAEALAPFGVGLWPLDLGAAPAELRRLLRKPGLDEGEAGRVRAHFLMPRARLLEVLGAAGRAPHVAGGGALETLDATHGVPYPELYQVAAGIDYSRFDRFHVNVADGMAVDEFMQVLAGGGVRYLQRLPAGGALELALGCPDAAAGWLVAYDGGRQHIGSFTACAPGSKILMQIIGPARWTMRYEDAA
jgi:hypothetical protein